MKTTSGLCSTKNQYMAQVPTGTVPSYFDLIGTYLQVDFEQENFVESINAALQQMGVNTKGKLIEQFQLKNELYIIKTINKYFYIKYNHKNVSFT